MQTLLMDQTLFAAIVVLPWHIVILVQIQVNVMIIFFN